MTMPVCVRFRQMQPNACSHEESGDQQCAGQWRPQGESQSSSDEGSQRKVGAGSRSAEIAERHDEQSQTQAVADESQ